MKKILLWCIRGYQKILSPDHSFWTQGQNRMYCKYYPTCSEYAHQAIEKFGSIKGAELAARRVCRCHPWAKGGVDLVPKNKSS